MVNDEIKTYYLYLHIRNDNNEIFYVGIGTKKNDRFKSNIYLRAYNKSKRTQFWHNIVNKTSYTVKIIIETTDRNFICFLEKYYIKLYGRKDLKTGTLVNLTDGGDANFNMNKETIDKIVKTKREIGSYEKVSNIMKEKMKGNKNGLNDFKKGKKIYVYDAITGNFLNEYISKNACSLNLFGDKKHKKRIDFAIKREGTYKGYVFLLENKGNIINPKIIGEIKNKIKVYYILNNEKVIFESLKDAALKFNVTYPAIRQSIIKNFKCKGINFYFL